MLFGANSSALWVTRSKERLELWTDIWSLEFHVQLQGLAPIIEQAGCCRASPGADETVSPDSNFIQGRVRSHGLRDVNCKVTWVREVILLPVPISVICVVGLTTKT